MKQEFDEQILDSLLAEMLTGQHPPDLTDRVLNSWLQEQEKGNSAQGNESQLRSGKQLIVAELVDASPEGPRLASQVPGNDRPDGRRNGHAIEKGQLLQVGEIVPKSDGEGEDSKPASLHARQAAPNSLTGPYLVTALALAGSLLVIAIGWRVFSDAVGPTLVERSDDPEALVVESRGEKSPEDRTTPPTEADGDKTLRLAQEERDTIPRIDQESMRQPNEFPELDEPHIAANDRQQAALATSDQANSGGESTPSMSSDAIVAELDQRLQNVWNDLGIRPSDKLLDTELAQKIHRTLVGKPIPPEQLTAYVTEAGVVQNGKLQGAQWARAVAESDQFPLHWAKAITRQWLNRGSLPLDGQPVRILTDRLAEQISLAAPWDQVPRLVLTGDVSQPELDNPSEVFLGALAGTGNHRLIKRIGTNFLNTNLACAQCHDGRAAGRAQLLNRQATYWSMVAMLNGIDAKGNGFRGRRSVLDRQAAMFADGKSPALFYDLVDGRLTTAEARLPGGIEWRETSPLPRQALAEWLGSTKAFDRAVVNQTWKLAFGKVLVPQVDGLDVTALDARHELLDFLALQFRTHNHDIKQLVTWVVGSDAFSRRSVELAPAQWLASTEGELAALQIADQLFANGSSLKKSNESRSLADSVAAIMRWSNPEGSIGSQNGNGAESTLAQPDAAVAPIKRPRSEANLSANMPSMRYVLYGERHTPAENAFVKSLVSAPRLNWNQQVEHIIALSEFETQNAKLTSLADELLERNAGDTLEALLDLLWSVKNANAG